MVRAGCCESKKIADGFVLFGGGGGAGSLLPHHRNALCAGARPLGSTRAGAVQLQQATHRAKVTLRTPIQINFQVSRFLGSNLVLEEEGLERSLGPVVEGKSKQLHGNGVDAQEVADKNHLQKPTR